MEENKSKNIFTEEKIKEEKPKFSQKKKGKVIFINKLKGFIAIDVNGNGEETKYIEERHSSLKIGDPIEF